MGEGAPRVAGAASDVVPLRGLPLLPLPPDGCSRAQPAPRAEHRSQILQPACEHSQF
jgi:hypothetical protein